MGQSHSTSSPKGAGTNEGEVGGKVDYYELLGVEQDASGEEIKKAYRKKALELHPDRNYGNVESATKLFAEVQSAYEILSDPQERAWYDSHRDAFLGSDGSPRGEDFSYNTRMTTCDDIFQMFSKFNPRMDFSDNETGFFGGLRETFTRLAVEERAASQWDHIDYIDYPAFGYRDDDFESTVRPFYAAWSGFSTRKSFAWKDIHRYSEAPDRRVRRLMEKENKRLREEGIREFNDAVRSLVAFVKKRDPRYRANAQSEAQRQEHLRQSVAAQAARSRAINNAKLREHVTPDWAKSEEADEDQDESSDTEMEHFECVVCHKNFKSQQQFEAHERSKKHTKAVKQLRWEMMAQDKQLNLDANENNSASSEADETRLRHSERSDFEPTPQSGGGINISTPNLDTFNSNETILQPNSQEVPSNASDSSMDFTLEHSQNWIPDADDGNADYAPRRLVEDRLHSELTPGPTADSDEIDSLSHHFSSVNVDKPPTAGKLGKAKQKRARKAAQQATEQPGGLKCATCNTLFPSKTQLFSHIRELDHARPLSNTAGAKGKMR